MTNKQGSRFKQAESYRLQRVHRHNHLTAAVCTLFCSSSEKAESPLHSKPSEILLPINKSALGNPENWTIAQLQQLKYKHWEDMGVFSTPSVFIYSAGEQTVRDNKEAG